MGSDSPEKPPYVPPHVRALSPVEKLASPITKTRPTLILAEDHPEFAEYFAGVLKEHHPHARNYCHALPRHVHCLSCYLASQTRGWRRSVVFVAHTCPLALGG